jgi:hypothetical protein
MKLQISHLFSISGISAAMNIAKKKILKRKYKQRYRSQNNGVLKFRNASNEAACSAIYGVLKNDVAGDSKFLGRYAVSRDVSKDQEVQLKLSSSTSRTCSRRHKAAPKHVIPHQLTQSSPPRRKPLILLTIYVIS